MLIKMIMMVIKGYSLPWQRWVWTGNSHQDDYDDEDDDDDADQDDYDGH